MLGVTRLVGVGLGEHEALRDLEGVAGGYPKIVRDEPEEAVPGRAGSSDDARNVHGIASDDCNGRWRQSVFAMHDDAAAARRSGMRRSGRQTRIRLSFRKTEHACE